MAKLEFFKSKRFFKYYLSITAITLSLTLFFNALGALGQLTIQMIAGVFTVIGVPLLIILILLIFSRANRNDDLGLKIIRINYLTIIIVCLCFSFLVMAGLLNSFYRDPTSVPLFGQLLSIYLFVICMVFGIGLSIVCYLTLSIEKAWLFQS